MEFVGTKFGANIKSLGSYLGTMENILFENVVLHDVEKAINIDLNGQDDDARVQTIRVKNVTFRNFTGDAKIAGTFTCPGPAGTCSGILLEDINITGTQKPNGGFMCTGGVAGRAIRCSPPAPCLDASEEQSSGDSGGERTRAALRGLARGNLFE
tara:strand:- start:195 stop:659 length:465 start_codon:yes stop_codon:yes gene_type:complete